MKDAAINRIVLAYSGGLATSVAIPWLAERYGAEVVTVTIDVGQAEALDGLREQALAAGAVRAHVIDARDEFAVDFVLPALQAGALGRDQDPLATLLVRPLIASHLVHVARLEGARAVAHCATDGADGENGLDHAIRALDPSLRILVPGREWRLTPAAQIDYAEASGIPVLAALEGPFATATNLWGRTIRGTAHAKSAPPQEAYRWTRPAADAPDVAASVEVRFERGAPVAVNDVELPLVDLIGSLTTIAGTHGIGRRDLAAPPRGATRVISEAPAAVVLQAAHRELQAAVMPPGVARLASDLASSYADLIVTGQWFSPAREAIDAVMATVEDQVTGSVRLELFKGDCRVVGRHVARLPDDGPIAVEPGSDRTMSDRVVPLRV